MLKYVGSQGNLGQKDELMNLVSGRAGIKPHPSANETKQHTYHKVSWRCIKIALIQSISTATYFGNIR